MKTPFVLASANTHKLKEFQELLGRPVLGLADVPGAPNPEETGATFEENAILKARSLADHTGGWALADDSGLEVDALGGAPGVFSARFAGSHGDDAANNRLLLEKLRDNTDRSARFVCVLALCGPSGELRLVRGECQGRIAYQPAGTSGFGYDPLFIPAGKDKSFAELGDVEKQKCSHRAEAVRKLRQLLETDPIR